MNKDELLFFPHTYSICIPRTLAILDDIERLLEEVKDKKDSKDKLSSLN